MERYLIALPCFKGSKGFKHKTILVSAKSKQEAVNIAIHLSPADNVGDVKRVNY